MIKLIKILSEEADQVYDEKGNTIAYYKNKDARPFFYLNNKIYLGDFGTMHYDIFKAYDDINISQDNETTFDGRFWEDKKLISFWNYPKNINELKKIAKDIKKETGINILGKDWVIEVLMNKKTGKIENGDHFNSQFKPILLPINDYKRSQQKQTNMKTRHTQSPLKKTKEKVPVGFGSKKSKKKYWESLIKEAVKEFILYKGDMIKINGIPLTLKQDALAETEENNIKLINLIPGGKGDNTKPEDVNQNELKVGIEVEMEHTNDRKKALEIALDHLTEHPQYYSILMKSGLVDEPKAIELYNKLLKPKQTNELNEEEKKTGKELKKIALEFYKKNYEPLLDWAKNKLKTKTTIYKPQSINIVRYPELSGQYGIGIQHDQGGWKINDQNLIYLMGPIDKIVKKFKQKYPFIKDIRITSGDIWKTKLFIQDLDKKYKPDLKHILTIQI
jgi:hypothetical protein